MMAGWSFPKLGKTLRKDTVNETAWGDGIGGRADERATFLLSAIVDSSDDAIISKDLNGIIRSWNKSAERLFGYTAAEAVGQSVATLLIPADRQEEEPEILSRLRRGERVDHFETKRRRKDGTLLDISLTISPVKDARGNIIGASKIARDITAQVENREALRRVNERLAQSNADLEYFAYSASHDLQEPLRMISAYSEMLRRKYGNRLDEKANQYLSYMTEGSARMERLLRDLRGFTHVSTHAGVAPEIDANAVLQSALTNLQVAIDESHAEVTSDPLPTVSLHEFQLEQLFQNIVGNAIHYRSEAAPRIHIQAEPHGEAWKFSIQDNGIGIAAEYKEKIFGLFKRLHTAADYCGSGMGLAICHRIVERVGGRIWVESQLGRGSTFFFTLPAGKGNSVPICRSASTDSAG
jgi:PAS domain S-box-containing protein